MTTPRDPYYKPGKGKCFKCGSMVMEHHEGYTRDGSDGDGFDEFTFRCSNRDCDARFMKQQVVRVPACFQDVSDDDDETTIRPATDARARRRAAD